MKDSPQYKQLKQAMDLIHELKIPEHLQEKALVHLLQGAKSEGNSKEENSGAAVGAEGGGTRALREFMRKYDPKGAVAEIPALLWWAVNNEKAVQFNEDDIVALYRRANIRPPKRVDQSMRDLASKKRYARLEFIPGKTGYVELSRHGDEFVRFELIEKVAKKSGNT